MSEKRQKYRVEAVATLYLRTVVEADSKKEAESAAYWHWWNTRRVAVVDEYTKVERLEDGHGAI